METEAKEIEVAKQPEPTKTPFWKQIKENGQIILIALLWAFLIRVFVAEPRYIPSDSMVPTLATGDRLVVEKLSYHLHPPHRGDIVVFQPPPQLQMLGYGKDQAFIKRVIGEPGQTVAVHDGIVYIDNQPLEEKYIAAAPRYELKPVQVPPDFLFVMGDNRNNSNDSHIWGYLPQKNVIGRAVYRFWPIRHLGSF